MCGNLCVHVNVIVECIVAAGFANVRGIRFRSVLRPLRSLAGYSDVAATVLADDGHNIIRLYALGHQVGLQLDDLFFGIRVARIRLDAKKGDVISAPRRMANLTLVEVDLMVIKESVQQLADKFGFCFRRVGVAVASDAAVHPSHQALLCTPSQVHLRVGAGHAEEGTR
jgi:hypothetical protein